MPTLPPTDLSLRPRRPDAGTIRSAQRQASREARRIRSTQRWRSVRASVLARAPLCADPLGEHRAAGRVVVAEEVHHRLPLEDRPDLAFALDNLMPLCRRCHEAIEPRRTLKEPR